MLHGKWGILAQCPGVCVREQAKHSSQLNHFSSTDAAFVHWLKVLSLIHTSVALPLQIPELKHLQREIKPSLLYSGVASSLLCYYQGSC